MIFEDPENANIRLVSSGDLFSAIYLEIYPGIVYGASVSFGFRSLSRVKYQKVTLELTLELTWEYILFTRYSDYLSFPQPLAELYNLTKSIWRKEKLDIGVSNPAALFNSINAL